YKKVSKPEKKIVTLDLDTIEYRDPVKPDMPELRDVKKIDVVEDRVRALVGGSGRAADLAWKVLAPTLAYSAMRLPEIADDVDTIDRALKLGFNWELGPFETWDALGFRATTERLRADGYGLPAWIDALYDSGADALYRKDGVRLSTPTGVEGGWADVAVDPRATDFAALRAEREVRSNASATLVDLGDEVLGLEFHSKMNAIDMDTIQMIVAAADEAERNWQAIVVGNDGVSFCAGANLMMLVGAAMQQDWKAIEHIIRSFQGSLDRIERCAVPVVMAPHGMALGGGAEVVMAGNTIRAAAESYVGLVEVGAGLIPAGGGCMRLYKRNLDRLTDRVDLFPALKTTFETIGMAKVSTSAEEARALGFLRPSDGWSMNGDHRVAAAKDLALAMARSGYTPPLAERQLPVMGRAGVAVIESALVNMHEGRYISGHDRKIGGEIARIISGGDVAGPTVVSEQHVLDLEVESFLRLCGEPKTHQRIESLLKTGKPVRN
ncbi:MAG: enoyl-CoA hydratase/isomerase family protein, partial [bacterium]|nr:enoyl-CoA hydratase/isomerase family protein [bacterium]